MLVPGIEAGLERLEAAIRARHAEAKATRAFRSIPMIGYRAYLNPATAAGPAYEDLVPDRAIWFRME